MVSLQLFNMFNRLSYVYNMISLCVSIKDKYTEYAKYNNTQQLSLHKSKSAKQIVYETICKIIIAKMFIEN